MENNDFIVAGWHYGDRKFVPEEVLDDLKKYNNECNLAMIRIRIDANIREMDHELCCKWAEYFRDNKIYFCFFQSLIREKPPICKFKKETVQKMYEIAGEYFLGNALGELGNDFSSHVYEYHGEENVQFKNMQEAKDTYVADVKEYVEASRKAGMKNIGVIQSHMMIKYDFEAGVDVGYPELFLGNPEHILSFTRGATRGRGQERFGGYVSHEWYGGIWHNDPLKQKRLGLMYKTAYMAGASCIFSESGYEGIKAYGQKGDENHPYCQKAREELYKFDKFIKSDKRPVGGPKVKVAFVSGNLDGYAGNSLAYGGVISPVWGQRGREDWDRGSSEYSWRILDEVYRGCDWHNPINYGDYDYSNAPAYGLYDVLPAEASAEVMSRYDWLIFTGWNTMTEEIYENLKKYVENGGNLLISAAHLKVGNERNKDSAYICDGKLEDFLGCNLTGQKYRSNKGFKFAPESNVKGVFYPGAADYTNERIDPVGSDGYVTYAEIEEKNCRTTAFLGKNFATTSPDYENRGAVLVENSYGKGNVLFMCSDEYPGAYGVYTLYKIIVKAILAGTHRNADIKVIGSDKVRFCVYEDESKYKIYLLNTDMNFEQKVRVVYNGESIEKSVPSTELNFIELKKTDI